MSYQQAETSPSPIMFYGWVIVSASFLMLFVVACNLYSFGVVFKSLQAEFGWSRTVTSSVMASYWVFHVVFAAPAGWLSDRYGPRVVLLVCNMVATVGLFLMSQVDSLWQIYLFFGVMLGCGLAGILAICGATTARWFVRRRGLALGVMSCGVAVGTIAAGPLVHRLGVLFGWRGAYGALGVLAFLLMVLPAFFIYKDPHSRRLAPYGLQAPNAAGSGSNPQEPEVREKTSGIRAEDSLSVRQIIHLTHFWIMLFVFSIFFLTTQLIMAHLYNHATDLGVSGSVAALLISIVGVGSLVGRLSIGALSDKLGPRSALIVCFSMITLSFFMLILARTPFMLILFAAVFGIAYGGEIPLIPGMGTHLFGVKCLGFVVGASMAAGGIGGATGPIVGGIIFDYMGSYTPAIGLATFMNLVCILFLLFSRMKRPAFVA